MSSLEPSLTDIVIVVVVLSETVAPLTPVTVIVCGVSQLPVVNVKLVADTVTSSVLLDATSITTFPTGCTSKTTVNVSVPPLLVTMASVLLNVKPAVSLSVVVTVTV